MWEGIVVDNSAVALTQTIVDSMSAYMCELLKNLADLVGKGESDRFHSLLDVLNHRNVHVPVEVREKLLYCVE